MTTYWIAAVLLYTVACDAGPSASQVNLPLARATVVTAKSPKTLLKHITDYSGRNQFAVQKILMQPRGELDFSVRLFRDDITLTVNRMKGESLKIAAFPLCACERETRAGLQPAADQAVAELRDALAMAD
jgi:hypothetical protein